MTVSGLQCVTVLFSNHTHFCKRLFHNHIFVHVHNDDTVSAAVRCFLNKELLPKTNEVPNTYQLPSFNVVAPTVYKAFCQPQKMCEILNF